MNPVILAFRHRRTKAIYKSTDNGLFVNKKENISGRNFTIASAIYNYMLEIYKVKDFKGRIFKIGDTFEAGQSGLKEKIQGFKPVFTTLYVYGKETTDDINVCTKY